MGGAASLAQTGQKQVSTQPNLQIRGLQQKRNGSW